MRSKGFFSVMLLLLLLTTILFYGCQKDTMTKIQVMEVTHSVFYAPQYVAITKGFFEDEGLSVELTDGKGADKVMAALLSNQTDIGFMGPEASVYVYNQGKENHVVNFAQLTQRDGSFIVSRVPEPDFQLEKLRGKEILGGRKGGMPNMVLEYVLKQKGLVPGVDLNVRTDVQFGVMAGAFAGGEGDYTTLFEPSATIIEQEGKGYVVASVGAESGYIPYTAYSATQRYIDENPEIVQKFTNAIYRGMLWVEAHSAEEVAESIQSHFPDMDLPTLATVVERYRSIGSWAPNPVLTEEGLNRLQEVMIDAGELEVPVPYDQIVVTQFAEEAMKNVK